MNYAWQSEGYLKISGWHGKYATERYRFVCPACGAVTILGTDGSRDGNIGSFACPKCGEVFHAYDEAAPGSPLHVSSSNYKAMVLVNLKQ